MENIINPTINKIEQDNKDVLKETMDLLVKKFNLELKKGNIAIKSVNDFTRFSYRSSIISSSVLLRLGIIRLSAIGVISPCICSIYREV